MMDLNLNSDWMCAPEEIQIGAVIVESEQGTTYEGEWKKQKVVIKVPKLLSEPTERELSILKLELSGIKRASHANLLPLLGACMVYPDTCYLVPYESKGNLKTLLDDVNIDISPGNALSMASQICKGLVFLHEMKPTHIAHGRLKTSNVLLKNNGTVALTDFGFSKSIFNSRLVPPQIYTDVDWFPPETLFGLAIEDDRAHDIYCFGLVLFSIIARQPLYLITNPMVIGYLVATKGMTPDIPEFIPPQLVIYVF
jgi:serine/threonine protein kinase